MSEKDESGVVSADTQEEIWKDIPGWSVFSASGLGRIRRQIDSEYYKLVPQFEQKTTKGTYLYSRVKRDDGIWLIRPVHDLVCLAFHDLPPDDGKVYRANHIDGDKHNNKSSNLEWLTHRDNILHALKTGLRNDNLQVTVRDLLTDEVTEYYSISEMARKWGMPRNNVKGMLARHSLKPYQGRWLFEISKERFGKIIRSHHDNIKAFDYVNDRILISSNAAEMYYLTGVHAATILNVIATAKDGSNSMVAGYGFKLLSDSSEFSEYSSEKAASSRDAYLSKPVATARKVPCSVKNYITGEIREYPSVEEVTSTEGWPKGVVMDLFRKKHLSLYKGRVCKRRDDPRPWPEYSVEKAQHSITATRSFSKALEVTDFETNTTKRYESFSSFALEIGKDPNSIGQTVKHYANRPEKLYLGRYRMTPITF